MPVVVVTAARLADEATELRAASALAACLAVHLDLAARDIYVSVTAVDVAVLGADAVRPWPVIVIYGRSAPRCGGYDSARPLAAELWNVARDDVWVQWITSEPTA